MSSPYALLPSEVWAQVFGYLGPADRLRVRDVCNDFRDLVEPIILFMTRNRAADLKSLQHLTSLEHLYLQQPADLSFHELLPLLPPQLTHLTVCEFSVNRVAGNSGMVNVLSFDGATHLKNLTSLVCHSIFSMEFGRFLLTILSGLPKLRDLSVSPPFIGFYQKRYFVPPPLRHRSLTSLEIIKCIYSLPKDVMEMMPCLRSLALMFHLHYRSEKYPPICSWLKDLPTLSSLLVVRGPCVKDYVGLIPPTVTSLTLRPAKITSEEMTALSLQLPNLLHLHLEPRDSLGRDTALIPRLFPRLQSLHLRHREVPEKVFLSLAELKELQLLETQDPTPPSAKLVYKLQELTKNRVQIFQRQEQDGWPCGCVKFMLTKDPH